MTLLAMRDRGDKTCSSSPHFGPEAFPLAGNIAGACFSASQPGRKAQRKDWEPA